MNVRAARIERPSGAEVRAEADYVLYWMTAARRLTFNFALDRAVEWALELRRPLLVVEPLLCGQPWTTARNQRFLLEGMAANEAAAGGIPGFAYYPYVERRSGEAANFVEALAQRAAIVIGDAHPGLHAPRLVRSAGLRAKAVEIVDSNGILPVATAGRAHLTAYSFRRFLQGAIVAGVDWPEADPCARLAQTQFERCEMPAELRERFPAVALTELNHVMDGLTEMDRSVPPVAVPGGFVAGRARLERFLAQGAARYAEARNEPEERVTSGLSPYLHAGHVSTYEVLRRVWPTNWSILDVRRPHNGRREGWWGLEPATEAFLDQLLTWRELAFNTAQYMPAFDDFTSLPAWARETLAKHRDDVRAPCYGLAELEAARTHDPLWNAAQRQLMREGAMHNYLRMLWGKKILQWAGSPETALEVMIHLNNQYALDGRDPNSYAGIFWVLGRYDRPFGPERGVFGKVRYMSSENTARKLKVRGYLARYAP